MRKVKEVLRLRFEVGLGQRAIARSCGMGLTIALFALLNLTTVYRLLTVPDYVAPLAPDRCMHRFCFCSIPIGTIGR